MDRSYDFIIFTSKYLYFSHFDDIIKFVTMFIKTIFKKLKELEIM